VPYYGTNFSVPAGKTVRRGRIYATATGIFTMRLNGKEVTLNKLEPGETEFEKSLLYSTYDVTALLSGGKNTLIAQVAGGMFNVTPLAGRYTKPEIKNSGESCLKAELFIDYTDGTTDHVVTDAAWRCAPSATTGSNWWGGEDYDARLEVSGVDQKGFDVSGWKQVEETSPTFTGSLSKPDVTNVHTQLGVLKARNYEPLRVVETWKATDVRHLANGNYLVDFGRNFAGQYLFTLKGEAGQTISLREGETLKADGSCKVDYYYSKVNDTYDSYTFSGKPDGETWGPQFMYHGFRYLEVSGLKSAPLPTDFTACRIRCNMEALGEVVTSNDLINQIHTICRDAIQSNVYNTVTDCPQREKLGWLDDDNEMFNSLSYNFDMTTMWKKVVMDCFDSQYADGHVPSTCPHFMCVFDDDPNWGGAAILVPYRSYKLYGDRRPMTTYYPQMKRLMDYYTSRTSGNIMPGSSYSVLSDWGQNTCGLAHQVPGEFTITTTYFYLLRAMAEMAGDLGYSADQTTYAALADKVKAAFNARFYGQYTAGVYGYGNQSELAMPLYYGLVDAQNEAAVAAALAAAVKRDNYRIKTGEIGLKPVLMSLAKYGYNDIVYRMANQTDYPSYGFFVKSGCTTTPEYWDLSMSQNHCMMDHIEEWLYSELGGIKNEGTAFDEFLVQPWISSDIKSFSVSLQSVYGRITSAYQRTAAGGFEYSVEVPAGSQATIVLPISKGCLLMEDGKKVKARNGITSIVYTDSLVTLKVGSGSYRFTTGRATSAISTTSEFPEPSDFSDFSEISEYSDFSEISGFSESSDFSELSKYKIQNS
jgi:alpha-L-rhamnosidase